jgi:hypothetical protein
MGLKMRITFQDTDFVYEILDGSEINKNTTQVTILLDQHQLVLVKDEKNRWTCPGGENLISADFVQAIGRSVSLRYRM